MIQRLTISLLAGCFLGSWALGNPLDRIILHHADTLRSKNDVRMLIGNVNIQHGDTEISAEKGYYDLKEGVIDLIGNVKLKEPDRRISANRISFYESTGNFEAEGEVDFLRSDSIRIRCALVRYEKEVETIELFDDLVIDILSDGSTVLGKYGFWKREQDFAVIEGDVVYSLPDSTTHPPDTLVIKSQKLELDRLKNAALFSTDVDLTKSQLLAVADTLFYQPDSNLTILQGAPVIWRYDDQLSGNRIELHFSNRELNLIEVNGNSVALSKSTPESDMNNRLAGRDMTITLVNDSTRIVMVNGDAEGEYHVWNEDGTYQGVNLSAADSIKLIIVNNITTDIHLEGSVTGAFYPPEDAPPGLTNSRTQTDHRKEMELK